jgi:hypothetical protein
MPALPVGAPAPSSDRQAPLRTGVTA